MQLFFVFIFPQKFNKAAEDIKKLTARPSELVYFLVFMLVLNINVHFLHWGEVRVIVMKVHVFCLIFRFKSMTLLKRHEKLWPIKVLNVASLQLVPLKNHLKIVCSFEWIIFKKNFTMYLQWGT